MENKIDKTDIEGQVVGVDIGSEFICTVFGSNKNIDSYIFYEVKLWDENDARSIVFDGGVPYLYGKHALEKFMIDSQRYKDQEIPEKPKLYAGRTYTFFKNISCQLIACELEKIGISLNHSVKLCTNIPSFSSNTNFTDYKVRLEDFLDYDNNRIFTIDSLLVPDGLGVVHQENDLQKTPSILTIDIGANKISFSFSKLSDGMQTPIGSYSTVIKNSAVGKLKKILHSDFNISQKEFESEFRNDIVNVDKYKNFGTKSEKTNNNKIRNECNSFFENTFAEFISDEKKEQCSKVDMVLVGGGGSSVISESVIRKSVGVSSDVKVLFSLNPHFSNAIGLHKIASSFMDNKSSEKEA